MFHAVTNAKLEQRDVIIVRVARFRPTNPRLGSGKRLHSSPVSLCRLPGSGVATRGRAKDSQLPFALYLFLTYTGGSVATRYAKNLV